MIQAGDELQKDWAMIIILMHEVMDINKIALDYIGNADMTAQDITKEASKKKRKTRRALINKYENLRNKYIETRKIVNEIRTEGLALQKRFDDQKEKMDSLHKQMTEIRDKLNTMDDDGKDYVEDLPPPSAADE